MKKIFFSILAITMISTAVVAEKGKTAKKHSTKKECPSNCQKTGSCDKMMHS
jgi:hypothetical protein